MSENTMREAFEAWYGKHYSKYALLSWNGKEYDNNDTELGWRAFRAAIAHQNQEAVAWRYKFSDSDACWVHMPHKPKVIPNMIIEPLFLAPPQPQEVADALEEACQKIRYYLKHQNYPIYALADEYEKGVMVTCENLERLIRALIK